MGVESLFDIIENRDIRYKANALKMMVLKYNNIIEKDHIKSTN
jgi:hypothetical protein